MVHGDLLVGGSDGSWREYKITTLSVKLDDDIVLKTHLTTCTLIMLWEVCCSLSK